MVGDMVNHKVDAIVNTANGRLRHDGELAKSIVDKGIYFYNYKKSLRCSNTHFAYFSKCFMNMMCVAMG